MAFLKFFLYSLPVLLLTGCYQDFTPELSSTPVLCINSLITCGEPIVVQVTHSWRYDEEMPFENHAVKDAKIKIIVNGNQVDETYVPNEGDQVRIIAESPIYGRAEGAVTVPKTIDIGKLSVSPGIDKILKDETNENHQWSTKINFNVEINVEINDEISNQNYYRFEYEQFPNSNEFLPEPLKADNQPDIEFYIGNFISDLEPILSSPEIA